MGNEALDRLVTLKIEKSKMDREESTLIMDKGISVYFLFLLIAIVGLVTGYLQITHFLILVCMAFLVLIVTSLPYIRSMMIEKKRMESLITQLEKHTKKK